MKSTRSSMLLAGSFLALLALPSGAQTAGPVRYRLESNASYTEGCYPPCLCPIFISGSLTGTYDLRYVSSDPAGFVNYDVTQVDWVFTVGSTFSHATGQGQYRIGGQFAIRHQLVLDLSINGGAPEHFDSGLVTPTTPFPRIDVAISKNGMYCYDKVFDLASTPDAAGVSYCFGDGSGAACPCGNAGNAGNGCANSVNASGANLSGTGTPSLAADSVVLACTGTPNASVLFFQGTQQVNGGAGAVFGDGLRCAAGTVHRLKTVLAQNGEARIPGPSDLSISVLGGISGPGTYDYQSWYRNAAAFCTPATFNLTNGYEVVWVP